MPSEFHSGVKYLERISEPENTRFSFKQKVVLCGNRTHLELFFRCCAAFRLYLCDDWIDILLCIFDLAWNNLQPLLVFVVEGL